MMRILTLSLLMACTAAPAPAPVAPEAPPASAAVEVPRDGKRLEPAVAVSAMPEGAWYCDMGTVHYARMTPGDGSCPVCGMALTHKAPAQAEPAPEGAAEPAPEGAAEPAPETPAAHP